MCTTPSPPEAIAFGLAFFVAPYGIAPLGAAALAWGRPTRRRALGAGLVCLAGALLATYLLTTFEPSPHRLATDTRYAFRIAAMRAIAVVLGVGAVAWPAAAATRLRQARVLGVASAAFALVASLAITATYVVRYECSNPGVPLPPTAAASIMWATVMGPRD